VQTEDRLWWKAVSTGKIIKKLIYVAMSPTIVSGVEDLALAEQLAVTEGQLPSSFCGVWDELSAKQVLLVEGREVGVALAARVAQEVVDPQRRPNLVSYRKNGVSV
jgi:hypothetical protein